MTAPTKTDKPPSPERASKALTEFGALFLIVGFLMLVAWAMWFFYGAPTGTAPELFGPHMP